MSVPTHRRRFWFWIVGAIGVASLTIYFLFFWKPPGRPYHPSQMSFDGTTESLQRSVVVPSLDSPVPQGKSAIWCSSFQLAWNHLKTEVAKGPIQLRNAEAVVGPLNRGEQRATDLDPQDVYAAAGLVKDGIIERIQAEMARKFPDLPAPALDGGDRGAVAYGYLRGQVEFSIPFFDNDDELLFTDSTGKKVAVRSFGIRRKDDYAYKQLREQVQVLYTPDDWFWQNKEGGEYIVDPCKDSDPYQIILACINRKPPHLPTLTRKWRSLLARTAPASGQ
jgi:hypothetical protein